MCEQLAHRKCGSGPRPTPAGEDGFPRRQVVRQQVPLAAGSALMEERADDLSYFVAALVVAERGRCGRPRGDHRLDQCQLLVGRSVSEGLPRSRCLTHHAPDQLGSRSCSHSGDDRSPMNSPAALTERAFTGSPQNPDAQ